MTPQEIKTKNMTQSEKEYTRIIAEFDGYEYCEEGDWMQYGGVVAHWDDLGYNTSYDKLLPLWQKFRDLNKTIKFSSNLFELEWKSKKLKIERAITYGTIQTAFTELGKAIKWYNENK